MAKVRLIPLGRRQSQSRIEFPERVSESVTELGSSVEEGLLAFAVSGARWRKRTSDLFRYRPAPF